LTYTFLAARPATSGAQVNAADEGTKKVQIHA
jgi:hypothetical protein